MNFIKKTLTYSLCALTSSLLITSCDSNNPDNIVNINLIQLSNVNQFTDNVWSYCYDTACTEFTVDGFTFGHGATAFEYDGITYSSWSGFCPSRVNDTNDYGKNWGDHQWACISGNPYNSVYLVGYAPADATTKSDCTIRRADYSPFKPLYFYVNNSSYTFFCAKNGSDFNEPFKDTDTYDLVVTGYRNGVKTGKITVRLISGGKYLTQWGGLTTEALGTVDEMVFTVESSSANQYGVNIPTYFCIADIAYTLDL